MTAGCIVGRLMFVAGVVAILASGLVLTSPRWLRPDYAAPLPTIEAIESRPALRPGEPLGVLEIPRLGLRAVVLESDEPTALLLAVGHLSDTPLPWHDGNSVLAGHRDTFFRPLQHIRPDDIIQLRTADAELEYVVRETKIVGPTDLEVLDPTPSPTLTLITCYPFNYIGPAPERFIVKAERRSRTIRPVSPLAQGRQL